MSMRFLAIGAAVLAALFTGYSIFYAATTPAQMGGQTMNEPLAPPVKGLYRGKAVIFIHTEASDPQVAAMLTRMMGPKVLVVPSLGRIPGELLADVYVFTNGVKGAGPFGFQVDVFDSVPGDARYTPLRAVTLVTWQQNATTRILKSIEEIRTASHGGQVTLKPLAAVVNMPILIWPGGQR